MKKAAIIFGAIAISIFLIILLFRIQHWPGAGKILLYGTILNLVIAAPVVAIYILSKKSPNRGMNFFGVISAFLLTAGWLFKVNHWPAAGIILTLGTALLIIFVILLAVNLSEK